MAWEITGYDSATELCRFTISGRYGRKRVGELLARLTCRDLEDYEIVEATTGERVELEVQRSGDGTLTCGSNPYYVARRVEK